MLVFHLNEPFDIQGPILIFTPGCEISGDVPGAYAQLVVFIISNKHIYLYKKLLGEYITQNHPFFVQDSWKTSVSSNFLKRKA